MDWAEAEEILDRLRQLREMKLANVANVVDATVVDELKLKQTVDQEAAVDNFESSKLIEFSRKLSNLLHVGEEIQERKKNIRPIQGGMVMAKRVKSPNLVECTTVQDLIIVEAAVAADQDIVVVIDLVTDVIVIGMLDFGKNCHRVFLLVVEVGFSLDIYDVVRLVFVI
ncbi:conserved hypothetical protein [Trichinella spiralis]|uniref:hypothetical protein n=1 Tax=Trichinella spiralis TaxID=6334 RepID=UPI0001EFE4FF|nr:conserved hypothetical protein [Trichinella spiralis]